MSSKNRTLCKYKKDIPETSHYAMLVFKIVLEHDYHDTGNPMRDRGSDYYVYHDRESWEAEIKTRTLKGDTDFVAMFVNPAKTTTEVNVSVSI